MALTDHEKKENRLEELLHTVKEGEEMPKMTDQEITGSDQFRFGPRSKLNEPKRQPTEAESKLMMAVALSWVVKYIMTNFMYTFGGEDRKQESGSPIGDEISQAVSRIVGMEYDEIFLNKLEELEIVVEIYLRYVDDQNLALWSIGRSMMFCPVDGALQQKSEVVIEDEKEIPEDVLVMREVRKIADTVMTMLKTEEDSPGNHPELGYKVPILDEAMWVENVLVYSQGQDVHSKCDKNVPCLPIKELECEGGLEQEVRTAPRMAQQIYYEFYTKPMKPKLVISADSALPLVQKRTVLTQECIRRLLNTK